MKKHFSKGGNYLDQNEMIRLVRELDPINDPLYSKKDDISLAKLFSVILRDHARYNTTAKEWYVYNGVVWNRDEQSMTVEQYAKMFGRCLEIYAIEKRSDQITDDRGFVSYYSKLGARANRKKLIEDTRDFFPLKTTDLDKDMDLFNCQNCVLNLRTFETMDHSPDLMLSKVSNVIYDPDAKSPDFEKFLDEVMIGDKTKIDYLQRIVGYSITGENTQEEFYMCYGLTTRNGKSTLLDVLESAFGDYAMNIEPETLALRDRNSKGASGDLARLNGCRFLHMSEPQKKMKFDVALLKKLLGRDRITVRHMYEREFEFIPVFKLFINTNHLPLVLDDTLFSSDRVKVIPFERHFKSEERDIHLRERLQEPKNISGIFNWCLEGLKCYQQEGEVLNVPECVKIATNDYREHSDKIQSFIDECLKDDPDTNISAKEAYNAFVIWCKNNGFGVDNKSNWLDDMRGKNMISASGTVNGSTQRNVIKGFDIEWNLRRELAMSGK